jgi:tetratricopeptide (TPR) repeat protein
MSGRPTGSSLPGRAGALVAGLALLVTASAGAQPSGKSQRAHQQAETGAAALAAGATEQALTVLEQAYRLAPLPEILYQLGRVAQAQGRTVPAADLYSRYLESTLDQADAATAELCSKYLRELKAPTAAVTVTAEQGVMLLVDGRLAGALPLSAPLLLSPGGHRFRIESGSRSYESDELAVPAGRQAELHLTPGAGRSAIAVLSLPPVVAILVSPAGLPPGTAETTTRLVADAVQKQHALAVPRDKLVAALPLPAAACAAAPDCQRALGEQTHAATVLTLQLRPNGQGGQRLRGQLLDVATGDPAASSEESCTGCTVSRALEPARGLAVRLLEQGLGRQRGTVDILTTPAGASVRLDGRLLGQTPLSKPAFVGDRDIVVERPGFVAIHAVLPVAVGQTAILSAQLVPLPR